MRSRPLRKVFLSYHFDADHLACAVLMHRVYYYLSKQPALEPYIWSGTGSDEGWEDEVGRAVMACDHFVLFLGERLGRVQKQEAAVFQNRVEDIGRSALCVRMPFSCQLPDDLFRYGSCRSITVDVGEWDAPGAVSQLEAQAELCAWFIAEAFCGHTLPSKPNVHVEDLDEFRRPRLLGDSAWVPDDGLPTHYLFDYEKKVIEAFMGGRGRIVSADMSEEAKSAAFRLVDRGCPLEWPDVTRVGRCAIKNPVHRDVIGEFRRRSQRVMVDTRARFHQTDDGVRRFRLAHPLITFPEAGPRARLSLPAGDRGKLTVAIVVSGGIGPGINAVLRSIVERHCLYAQDGQYKLDIFGYRNGLIGLRAGSKELLGGQSLSALSESVNRGGSFIGTSRLGPMLDVAKENRAERVEDMQKNIVARLIADAVDILYVIGGDGTMRAAHAIWMAAEQEYAVWGKHRVSVVGIPKTVENDILWVWQGFGLLSAVEEAKECILHLDTEVRSNPRLCVAQLPGSESGFVVSYVALASGVCDLALIPEVEFSMDGVFAHVWKKLKQRADQAVAVSHGLVVMAETAIPIDCDKYLYEDYVGLDQEERDAIQRFQADGRRVRGQTPDALRRAGLKLVSRVLEKRLRDQGGDWSWYRVVTNELRHLVRSVDPGVQDAISAQRLGALAVDSALAGYTDFMISQWVTEYVLVPLKLVVLGRKRVPKEGIFWKSVLACTGQPSNLVAG